MLPRLAALIVLAIVAYYAVTEGWPRLRAYLDSGGGPAAAVGSGSAESRACVAAAGAARDSVTAELIPAARPPVDPAVWGTAVVRIAGALADADRACACVSTACAKASQAIDELRGMFDAFDEMVRGGTPGMSNPASRLERADALLEEARWAASSG